MCLSEQLSTFFFKNKQKQMVKKSIINETNNFKDPFEKKSVYQFISELYNIVKSKLVCNFPRSSVNPLTHPHVNIRVTITVKIPNV
jgi:hypothetical protein